MSNEIYTQIPNKKPSQSSTAPATFIPSSNTNSPVIASQSSAYFTATPPASSKMQLGVKRSRTAMSIPSSLAKGEFADVIKERIKQGINANPQYKLLLELLVNPAYKEHEEFLKEQIRNTQNGTLSADAQAYLIWLEKNYDKMDPRATSGKFEEEAIDLYIREEIEVQIRSWNVPNLPSHFIGRESLLEHLAQRLNPKENQTATVILTALHGLGGVGKTFLAARYAQLYAETYNFILWFNAESETTLINDYHNFADAFHLPIEGQSPENILIIIKNWLQQQSNWLIIYDNALDDQLIVKFRPAKGGKILITSRKESWGKKDSLAIDVFSPEEARAYIVELTDFSLDEHQGRIDELANTLGYLPLALAQACAYISVNNLSLEDYLELYAESRAEMLADETMPVETNHEPVAITWHITFKAIEKQNTAASVLLESCAFLQGSSIPEFLLKELFAKQQPTLAKQTKPFIDVTRCLQQYSMLKLISEKKDKAFNMHNLVQEVIFDRLSSTERQACLIAMIQLYNEVFPHKEIEQVEDYAKQRVLLPHLEKGLQWVEVWLCELKKDQSTKEASISLVSGIEKGYLISLLILSAHGYDNLGDYKQAKPLFERALKIYEHHDSNNHPLVADILNGLANTILKLGDAKQAQLLCERALKIQEQHYGKEHPQVATTLNNLANTYATLGHAQQAKPLYERVLKFKEQHYGKDHPQVAVALDNLASTANALGDAKQAKILYERALKIDEQYYGKDHPEVARTLYNLATTIDALGDAQQAKLLLERALKIDEQYYGKDHPEVARTLCNLATAIADLGDAQQAKLLLERALKIQEQYYDKDHPMVAKSLSNLASTMRVLGNAQQAKLLLERVLTIDEQYYGKEHPEVARTLSNLAGAIFSLDDAQQAKPLYERALKIQEQYYGKEHPMTARNLMNLAAAMGKSGDAQQAKLLLERALKIEEEYYGKGHPMTARSLMNLATTIRDLGDLRQAKPLYERALKIEEEYYGKDNPMTMRTLINLATTVKDLGNAEQAKLLFSRVLKIQEQYYGKEHPKVAVTLVNLAIAYGTLGDAKQAKPLLERALKIQECHYGKEHPQVAITLNNLANVYAALDDVERAIQLYEHVLKIKEKYYGKDHLEVAFALYNLVSVYVKLAEWSTVKIMAEHAYQIFSSHPNVRSRSSQIQAAKKNLEAINAMLATFSPEQLSALHAHDKISGTEENSSDLAKALRNAANQNNVEKLKELLSQVANVNAKDDGQYGLTALHWAVIKQALPCIKLLLTAGADAMMVDNAGKSSIDYAGENPLPNALFLLLSHYYKLPLEDIEPGKLLRRAAHQNRANVVKLLLKHIKDINEKDASNTQRTALHWAVIQHAADCIKLLMAAGADPYLADGQSKTAYDYAQGKPVLLSLLQSTTTQTYIP